MYRPSVNICRGILPKTIRSGFSGACAKTADAKQQSNTRNILAIVQGLTFGPKNKKIPKQKNKNNTTAGGLLTLRFK
jgi:hypothetical protein